MIQNVAIKSKLLWMKNAGLDKSSSGVNGIPQ